MGRAGNHLGDVPGRHPRVTLSLDVGAEVGKALPPVVRVGVPRPARQGPEHRHPVVREPVSMVVGAPARYPCPERVAVVGGVLGRHPRVTLSLDVGTQVGKANAEPFCDGVP